MYDFYLILQQNHENDVHTHEYFSLFSYLHTRLDWREIFMK